MGKKFEKIALKKPRRFIFVGYETLCHRILLHSLDDRYSAIFADRKPGLQSAEPQPPVREKSQTAEKIGKIILSFKPKILE
ncbi:MAG: hypothetical protein ONB51_09225 [candidate division KSB1 bacterium]|nr:hypothetical protein [candidate division KSB1 bacterium]MDZ7409408.1 hypothetical protein [candidate division KSB1 bacterium]